MDCLRIGRAKQNDTRGAIVNYANAIGLYSFDTEPVHNKFISSVLEKVGNIGIQSRNYVTALDALGKLLSNLQIAGNKLNLRPTIVWPKLKWRRMIEVGKKALVGLPRAEFLRKSLVRCQCSDEIGWTKLAFQAAS